MKLDISPLGRLTEAYPAGHLCRAWVAGTPPLEMPSATAELSAALAAPTPAAPAPLWQVPRFAGLLPAGFRDLPGGPAVVVTGQQPGYLGGPLLTLHKIATAVALAAQRTAAGRPTVPVFWSGDDDDDLAEALAPVGWTADGVPAPAPARERLRRADRAREVLSGLGPEVWAAGVPEILAAAAAPGGWAEELDALVAAGRQAGTAWGQAQTALLQRIFTGTPLVVVRGDDAQLHAAGAGFYAGLGNRRDELAGIVRQRGEQLAAAGYGAQIADRSLARSLYVRQAGARVPLASADTAPADRLRPGVMLRSPLQDWLLRPAAVVVGPGELAYLKQLDPLYAALSLPRCALVPRLTGWVLPAGEAALAAVRGRRTDPGAGADAARAWADQVAAAARAQITVILAAELGLPAERAAALAEARARRFHKGLRAMFAAEAQRLGAAGPPGLPPWVLPGGRRQERVLGLAAALGRWGEGLVTGAVAAAGRHLEAGGQGAWREWVLSEPEGTS